MVRSLALVSLCIALGALSAEQARALACTPDPVPAATLLLPYFDLDVRDLSKPKPKRETTLISVMNMGPAPVFARVTLWTDLSVPTLAFDLQLTGYDVEQVDLWQVFRGTLPGDLAIPCDDGVVTSRQLTPEQIESLRLAHSGQPDPANEGLCSGVAHGDTLLRGYVTIDNSGGCSGNSAVFPSDPGYFGPGGIALNDNVLTGESLVQGRKRKIAESSRLVAIEASDTFGPGDATFYGRYVGYSGADAREPLPDTWAARYLNDAKQSTELVVWRNSEAVQGPFACQNRGESGWYPLTQSQIVWFDEAENGFEAGSEPALPAEANRVSVGGSAFPIVDPGGWIFLNLNLALSPDRRQSYVMTRVRRGPPSARSLVEATALLPSCGPAPAPAEPILPPFVPLQRLP